MRIVNRTGQNITASRIAGECIDTYIDLDDDVKPILANASETIYLFTSTGVASVEIEHDHGRFGRQRKSFDAQVYITGIPKEDRRAAIVYIVPLEVACALRKRLDILVALSNPDKESGASHHLYRIHNTEEYR